MPKSTLIERKYKIRKLKDLSDQAVEMMEVRQVFLHISFMIFLKFPNYMFLINN
jgi:hypothetical protein